MLFISVIVPISLAYLPPVYIANPETGECKYYFAGDALHFNNPPNGTWYIVGVSETGIEECSDRCFFNSNKFWQEVLTVTRASLNLSDVPQDYRIFENLGCLCSGNGSIGCENWCHVNSGELNSSNWTNSVSCKCSEGNWVPGKGCQASNGTSIQTGQKETVSSLIIFLIVFVSGLLIGLFAGTIRASGKNRFEENKLHEWKREAVHKKQKRARKTGK